MQRVCPFELVAMAKPIPRLTSDEVSLIVSTAWEDKVPFHQVLMQYGLGQGQLVPLMKRELTPSAFKLWKQRSGVR